MRTPEQNAELLKSGLSKMNSPVSRESQPNQPIYKRQPQPQPAKTSPGAFDKAVLGDRFEADQGMYDKFTDSAYQQATRTLDPYYDDLKKRFEQNAINKGLAPNTEGYNTAFDQFMRQQNDAYSTAAFDAMRYGSERLDADRGAHETARQFDSSLTEGGRQFDVDTQTALEVAKRNMLGGMASGAAQLAAVREGLQEQQRQFDEGTRRWDMEFGENNSRFNRTFDLNELLSMEGVADTYRDDAYRDAVFNSQQDQQQFNNLYTMMGLVPGANAVPTNTSSAYDNQLYADIHNSNNQQAFNADLGQVLAELAKAKPWENEE